MAKHISIEQVVDVVFECDRCGEPIALVRKAPAKCDVCGKDLCKSCKRHIHVEIGSGNGQPIDHQTNTTKNYCPECLEKSAVVIEAVLAGDISQIKDTMKVEKNAK